MHPQDSCDAQQAAIVSFKQQYPTAEANACDARALPAGRSKRKTRDEDIEMVDAEFLESREAPTLERESVVSARSSLPAPEGLVKKSCKPATIVPKRQPEHEHISQATLHSTATDPKTRGQLEKKVDGLKEHLQSTTLGCKKLREDAISNLAKTMQTTQGIGEHNVKRSKRFEEQIDEWGKRAGLPDRGASTTQHQWGNVENGEKMHEELYKGDGKTHHLRSQVDGEKNSSRRLEATRVLSQENDNLTQQREELIQQRANLTKCNKEWSEAYQQIQKRYASLENDNKLLQERADHHKDSAQRAILENKMLQERIDEQELSVTKAQNAAMSVLSHSLSAPLPDDLIRSRFNELFGRIAEWARDNAAAPDRAMLAHPDNLLQWQEDGLLRQIMKEESTPNLNFDLRDDTAVDTLLNAALTRHICQGFFRSPFWFAEDSSPISDVNLPQEERYDTVAVLDSMLEMMTKFNDGARVHSWRASTVETLASSEQVRKKISASYKRYLKDDLLPHCEGLIRTPLPQSERDELLAIVESFGNFTIELWSQKTEVDYYCLESFENKTYRYGSKYMEIARAVEIEEGDVKLDGRPIPVVVQPLIMGFGTHDGKEYGKSRVWSKAVVWVSADQRTVTMPGNAVVPMSSVSRLLRVFGVK